MSFSASRADRTCAKLQRRANSRRKCASRRSRRRRRCRSNVEELETSSSDLVEARRAEVDPGALAAEEVAVHAPLGLGHRLPLARRPPAAAGAGTRAARPRRRCRRSPPASAPPRSPRAAARRRSDAPALRRARGPTATVTTNTSPWRRASSRCRTIPGWTRSKTPWLWTTVLPAARAAAHRSAACSSVRSRSTSYSRPLRRRRNAPEQRRRRVRRTRG